MNLSVCLDFLMAEANPTPSTQPSEEEKPSENYERYLDTFKDQMQARTRQAQRSEKQTTIFLYGISGGGKSSTINYLFHKQIVQTSEELSITRDVSENSCAIFSESFRSYIDISFIDTPGFDDTKGKDPENLAKISHFIDSNFSLHKIFPNIVLIVVSAEDKRLKENNSKLSRILHVLSKLNVVDIFHPNVVIAVTNAMYFTKKEYKAQSKRIEETCKVLARAHLSIEVPVMFIENLDKRGELKQEGEWKILPDGTRQPLNLFQAMIHLMKQSGDEVGAEAIRLLFSESSSYEIDKLSSSTALLHLPETDYAKWEQCIGEKLFNPEESDIYSSLLEYIGFDDIRIFPLVYNLQKNKIVEIMNLTNQDLSTIQQTIHPYQLTNEETDWLVHLFKVSRIDLSLDFSSLGVGYSRQSKIKRNRVIETGPLKGVNCGNYSMNIPESCSVKDVRKIVIDINHDKDATKHLFRHLKITFRISYVLFQVDIDDLKNLNGKFIGSLEKSLPRNLDMKMFADQYTHCTTGLYFGGFVEGELFFCRPRSERDSERAIAEKSAELLTQLESYFKCTQNQTDQMKTPHNDEIQDTLKSCQLHWKGGKRKYYSKSIFDVTPQKWDDWTSSIGENIICLDNIVNSKSLHAILSNFPRKEIRSYAPEFPKTEEQTDLTNQNFQGCFITIPNLESNSEISYQEEDMILTRIEASARAKSHCYIL